MYAAKAGQQRIDRFVLVLAALLVVAMVGMFANNVALILVPVPLIVTLLTLLSVLDRENGWPDRGTLTAVVAFHSVSTALWLIALLAVHDESIVIGGMPLSTGILTLVLWPFYTVLSGPLYAFCCERLGLVRDHELFAQPEIQKGEK